MNINVDLSEVFEDEDGGVFHPEIKDLIVNGVINTICRKLDGTITQAITDTIGKTIADKLTPALEAVIEDLMDYEFTETSSYGATKTTTTVRNRILNQIEKLLVWKDSNYDSDKNAYTKALSKIVEKKLDEFGKEYQKAIDDKFVAECIGYVQKRLQGRLGIKLP